MKIKSTGLRLFFLLIPSLFFFARVKSAPITPGDNLIARAILDAIGKVKDIDSPMAGSYQKCENFQFKAPFLTFEETRTFEDLTKHYKVTINLKKCKTIKVKGQGSWIGISGPAAIKIQPDNGKDVVLNGFVLVTGSKLEAEDIVLPNLLFLQRAALSK